MMESWEHIKSNIESTHMAPVNSEMKIFFDGEEVNKSDLKKLLNFAKSGKLDEIMNQK